MKKVWNAPDMQELTIQSTAFGYGSGHGYGGHGGHGGHGGYGHGGHGGHGGQGNGDLCRCQGGTSPCSKHHGWGEEEPGDDLS